jgi:putative nucleotidyltransferase with HDIG domain
MIAHHPIELETLVKLELPPLPDVVMRVAALTQDPNTSTRAIAEAIGLDPALGARVLRAANSPLYYLERDVTSLTMAVNALGNDGINLLVVASAASDAFQKKGRRLPEETTLWGHSLAVGLAAREIMAALGLRALDQGFICGLLHDIGKLLLLRHDTDGYRELTSKVGDPDFLNTESEVFGYTHAQVGALVAKRWNLPEAICHAIYHHHQPSQAGQGILVARVVEVADALANKAGVGLRAAHEQPLADSESAIALRLSEDQLNTVWEKTNISLSATFALFS